MGCKNNYQKEDIIKNFGKDEFDKNCKNCDNYVYDDGIAYCKYAYELDDSALEKIYKDEVNPIINEIPKEFLFDKEK